jgi:hypothetical protein
MGFFHGFFMGILDRIFSGKIIYQWGYNYGEFSPINYDITPNTMMTHLHVSLELLPQVVSGNQHFAIGNGDGNDRQVT